MDLVTDGLKEKLLPVSRKLKEIEKERAERRKVRKRTKAAAGSTAPAVTNGSTSAADVEMGDASATTTAAAGQAMDVVVDGQKDVKEGGELEDESIYRSKEVKELDALVDPTLKNDIGCSVSGLYDLVGESSRFSHLSFLHTTDSLWSSHRYTQRCCSRCRALYGICQEECIPLFRSEHLSRRVVRV